MVVFLTSSLTKSAACVVAFLFPKMFLLHSLSISIILNISVKSSSAVILLLLRACRERFLNSTLITFLDCSLQPSIKIFKAYEN